MPTGRIARVAPLVGLAGRTAGEAVVASLGRRIRGIDADANDANGSPRLSLRQDMAQRYVEQLGHSKGVLMKVGQILSLTSLGSSVTGDGEPFLQRALSRLHDDAPPMSAELAMAALREELGDRVAEFASFDAEPVAAASIGQVHFATLLDGTEVAVKIQYPGVAEAMRVDLKNTELIATFLQLMRGALPDYNKIDPRAIAAELAVRIDEEIDYELEAATQMEFAQSYQGHPFIRIPEVFTALSTRRVLTMERGNGRRYAQVMTDGPPATAAQQQLRDQWGEAIWRFSLGSMRRLGLFHADPHPGNFLFNDDGSVTVLDFGCVKRFTPEQIRVVRNLLQATLDGDGQGAVLGFAQMGVFDLADPPDPEAVLRWHRQSLSAMLEPQPFRFTPEYAASAVQAEMSSFGPHRDIVRNASIDPEYMLLTRIQLGLNTVLAGLYASGNWRAIRDEWDCNAEAASPLGEQDLAFWAEKPTWVTLP